MDWSPRTSAQVARGLLSGVEPRWSHVSGVARRGGALAQAGYEIPAVVISAAWLHDIGYADTVRETELHAHDGARWLEAREAPAGLVALVGHHSGAWWEADERGLLHLIEELPKPDRECLDLLTMLDMTTSPKGRPISVEDRLGEILERYPVDSPVHRAVTRSSPYLIEACARAADRLGLADVRTRPPL